MEKLKICVYAISKNEEKFVDRWVKSMSEADEIYVLDTGSTDSTVKKFRDLGVNVKTEIISPWRFDIARNMSLDMLPEDTDICVCTDLDEVFEKGWRQKLENAWKIGTTRARYSYNWAIDKKGNPRVSFKIDKIHVRFGYKWTHPVHEVLSFDGVEKYTNIYDIVLNHYPDSTKSRSSYLPLLELSVKENPTDDRNMHYLGREYMYYKRYNEAIDTLLIHLSLPTATWKDERCASMRFIARCYSNLGRYNESRMWLDKAIREAPYLRDPYVERAILEYKLKNWYNVKKYCLKALRIKTRSDSYINEEFSWDTTIYDLLSLSYYHLGNIPLAIKNINIALKMDKGNPRLINNKKVFKKLMYE